MKIKKLIIAILTASFILCLSVFSYQAYSYFTDKDQAINKMHIAYNSSEIIENFPSGQVLTPDGSITKQVSIKNTGNVTCYFRAMILFSDDVSESNVSILQSDKTLKKWKYDSSDGYWYYSDPVEPNKSTERLMDGLKGNTSYNGESFDIYIYQESVQAKDTSTGNLYKDAKSAFKSIEGM